MGSDSSTPVSVAEGTATASLHGPDPDNSLFALAGSRISSCSPRRSRKLGAKADEPALEPGSSSGRLLQPSSRTDLPKN